MKEEFIYVFYSKSMPQAVKIGYSSNCTSRLTEINRGNELPFPFKMIKKWRVSDAFKLEQEIHRHLDFCRVAPNREFFTISPQKAVEVIDKIIEDGTYEFFARDSSKNMVKVKSVESLGRVIRRERKRHKLTQRQLAFAAGTGLRFIIEIERGKNTAQIGKVFTILSLLRLECLFEVSV